MQWFLLGVLALIGLLWLGGRFSKGDPQLIARRMRFAGGILAGAAALFFTLTGKPVIAAPLFGVALWLWGKTAAPWARLAGNRQAGQHSGDDQHRPHPDPSMSRAEAYRVLGLEYDASEVEIKTAYKRLMAKVHPDQGGSTELARQINQARDTLSGR